jgi:hypothetical protein
LQERTGVVVDHVRDLSHDLHPATLDTSDSSRPCVRTARISPGRIGSRCASAPMERSRRSRARSPCACIGSCRRTPKRRQARRGSRCQRVADADR